MRASKDSSGKDNFYAVEPFCMPFQSRMSQLDFLTLTSSYELCESITDPIPGQGRYWFKDQQNQGEIGDICEAAPMPKSAWELFSSSTSGRISRRIVCKRLSQKGG
jgi:hypothetical protein